MGARGRRIAERRGPKPQHKVALTAPEYREVQRLARRRTASYAEVVRAKILLLTYEHPDWSKKETPMKITVETVAKAELNKL
jgi:hypothetical protein